MVLIAIARISEHPAVKGTYVLNSESEIKRYFSGLSGVHFKHFFSPADGDTFITSNGNNNLCVEERRLV